MEKDKILKLINFKKGKGVSIGDVLKRQKEVQDFFDENDDLLDELRTDFNFRVEVAKHNRLIKDMVMKLGLLAMDTYSEELNIESVDNLEEWVKEKGLSEEPFDDFLFSFTEKKD